VPLSWTGNYGCIPERISPFFVMKYLVSNRYVRSFVIPLFFPNTTPFDSAEGFHVVFLRLTLVV